MVLRRAALFYGGTVTGAVGVLILLVATGVAVLTYWTRHPHEPSRPRALVLATTALGTLGLAVLLATTLVEFHLVLGVDAGSPAAWIWPSVFAAAVLGAAWALVLRRRPHIWRRLGYGTSAALVDAETVSYV